MKRCNLILLFLDRLDGKEELQLLINKLNKEMGLLDGSVIVEDTTNVIPPRTHCKVDPYGQHHNKY